MSVREELNSIEIKQLVNSVKTNVPKEYEGFYQIWLAKSEKGKKQFRRVAGVRHMSLKLADFQEDRFAFKDDYGQKQEINFNDATDYYITRNTMRGASKFGRACLWNISKIVIDIDVSDRHKPLYSYYSDAIKLIDTIKRELVFKGDLPVFDWVFTGRGVHLHYDIEPIHSEKQAFLADIFVDRVTDKINKVLYKYKHTKMYEVDKAASKNHGGLVRFAGINQKSKEAVRYHKEARLYNIDELMRSVNYVPLKKRLKTKKEAPRATETLHTSQQSKNYAKGLNIRFKYLQAYREQNSSNVGYRNKMCFLYLNNSLSYMSIDHAVSSLYKFNQGFSSPLQSVELEALISHLESRIAELSKEERKTWQYGKGLYRYRKQTVIETLNITEEEIEHLEKTMTRRKNHSEAGKERTHKQNKKRKEQRRQRQEYERQKRLNVLKDTSLTAKEQAELLEISIPRVYQLRKELL